MKAGSREVLKGEGAGTGEGCVEIGREGLPLAEEATNSDKGRGLLQSL